MATTATSNGQLDAALSRAGKHAHLAEEHLSTSRQITATVADKDRLVATAGVHSSLALYYQRRADQLGEPRPISARDPQPSLSPSHMQVPLGVVETT